MWWLLGIGLTLLVIVRAAWFLSHDPRETLGLMPYHQS